ncbi:MAG TPA: GNAT family N-acetyltransferase [Bacteroidota bacterium]
MSLRLEEIRSKDLTTEERQSIFDHALDLHLVGGEEVDNLTLDILERDGSVKHLLRIVDGLERVGVLYILPVASQEGHLEMTILVHGRSRGKGYTAQAVQALEAWLSQKYRSISLCATVREHNPLRKELTKFLIESGYLYEPEKGMFVKKLK